MIRPAAILRTPLNADSSQTAFFLLSTPEFLNVAVDFWVWWIVSN